MPLALSLMALPMACFIARRNAIRFSNCAEMLSATSCALRSGCLISTTLTLAGLPTKASISLRSFSISAPPLPMMMPGFAQWRTTRIFALSLSNFNLGNARLLELFLQELSELIVRNERVAEHFVLDEPSGNPSLL